MGLITVTRFNKGHKWDLKTNSPCSVLTSSAERRGEGRWEEGGEDSERGKARGGKQGEELQERDGDAEDEI